jgi:Clp amino terminal domain, pathogenicity island component
VPGAETLAAGAPAAGSREVLLGVLRTECGPAQALRSEGVTLEKARACAPLVDSGGDGDSSRLERIVRRAERFAAARGDEHVSPEQLLLAAIADADRGARGTLAALGAAPLAFRARLGC